MSDTTTEAPTPLDFTSMQPVDAPIPDAPDDAPIPDHTASADLPTGDAPGDAPLSVVERVKRKTRGGGKSSDRPKAAKAPKEPPPKPRPGSLVRPLTEFYTSIGLVIAPFDPVCSTALLDNAEACAKSLDTLARENESVRRAILALTQTSAWGGVMIAHLPLLLILTVHHGPRDVANKAAPLAAMMAPNAMQTVAQMQTEQAEQVHDMHLRGHAFVGVCPVCGKNGQESRDE